MMLDKGQCATFDDVNCVVLDREVVIGERMKERKKKRKNRTN